MKGLVTEFLDIIRKNNTNNLRHALATDSLYTSENLLIKNGESLLNDCTYEFYYKILNGNKFMLTKYTLYYK